MSGLKWGLTLMCSEGIASPLIADDELETEAGVPDPDATVYALPAILYRTRTAAVLGRMWHYVPIS